MNTASSIVKKSMLCCAIAAVMLLAACKNMASIPTPTGNSTEIRDVLSGKIFMWKSGGFIQQSWYVTFNYDGTYAVAIDGVNIAKGTYSLTGATVNLMPVDVVQRADIFGVWEGALDSAENPTQMQWNMAVYKLVK
jgi:hypothetical protein